MFRCVVLVALMSLAASQGQSQCNGGSKVNLWEDCVTCSLFKKPKEVTLRVVNVLTEPTFDKALTVNCTRYKTLFYIMQEAAEADTFFRFTCKYYGKELGFFIEAINGLFGNWQQDKTWWEILDNDLNRTPVGASNYIPSDGETVTFNYTQGRYDEV